jgi:hypothetical protein
MDRKIKDQSILVEKSIEISIGFLHRKLSLWNSIEVLWSLIELYGELLYGEISMGFFCREFIFFLVKLT